MVEKPINKGVISIFSKVFVNKIFLTIAVVCVLVASIFDTIPWILTLFGYNDFYNSRIRATYNSMNLYILIPLLGTLSLLPLLIQNSKKIGLWILLILQWFMFLVIVILSILIAFRIIPGAP